MMCATRSCVRRLQHATRFLYVVFGIFFPRHASCHVRPAAVGKHMPIFLPSKWMFLLVLSRLGISCKVLPWRGMWIFNQAFCCLIRRLLYFPQSFVEDPFENGSFGKIRCLVWKVYRGMNALGKLGSKSGVTLVETLVFMILTVMVLAGVSRVAASAMKLEALSSEHFAAFCSARGVLDELREMSFASILDENNGFTKKDVGNNKFKWVKVQKGVLLFAEDKRQNGAANHPAQGGISSQSQKGNEASEEKQSSQSKARQVAADRSIELFFVDESEQAMNVVINTFWGNAGSSQNEGNTPAGSEHVLKAIIYACD